MSLSYVPSCSSTWGIARYCLVKWDIKSLRRILGMLRGSAGTRPVGIQIRCQITSERRTLSLRLSLDTVKKKCPRLSLRGKYLLCVAVIFPDRKESRTSSVQVLTSQQSYCKTFYCATQTQRSLSLVQQLLVVFY